MYRAALEQALTQATRYLDGIAERPVAQPGPHDELIARLGGPMPEVGEEAAAVVRDLAVAVDPALIASGGGRYFGFVIGGTLPAALAADWLTSAWDQNAGLHAASPAAALVESIVAGWLLELLGLPATASVGLVTGGQMANFTGLAAGRDEVLRRHGWDLAAQGLHGAPPIRILAGEEAHATIHTAVRLLGMGRNQVQIIPADGQGRMRADALAERLETSAAGPTIVCAQAGLSPLAAIPGV
jgi:glutamate/tyrosine decarboxylase-like PLP-dependent enzyme